MNQSLKMSIFNRKTNFTCAYYTVAYKYAITLYCNLQKVNNYQNICRSLIALKIYHNLNLTDNIIPIRNHFLITLERIIYNIFSFAFVKKHKC